MNEKILNEEDEAIMEVISTNIDTDNTEMLDADGTTDKEIDITMNNENEREDSPQGHHHGQSKTNISTMGSKYQVNSSERTIGLSKQKSLIGELQTSQKKTIH